MFGLAMKHGKAYDVDMVLVNADFISIGKAFAFSRDKPILFVFDGYEIL